MPTYEVRRRTVLPFAVVTAANETEARRIARDVFVQDAQIAALSSTVTRQRHLEPYDREQDERSDARYEETEADRESETFAQRRLGRAVSDSEALEPW